MQIFLNNDLVLYEGMPEVRGQIYKYF
jgi:hypothetical protein